MNLGFAAVEIGEGLFRLSLWNVPFQTGTSDFRDQAVRINGGIVKKSLGEAVDESRAARD